MPMPGTLLTELQSSNVRPSKLAATMSRPDLLLIGDHDVIYEQDILRNPGSTKPWLVYAEFKRQHGSRLEQAFVLERACAAFPRSYKLWKMYLDLRTAHLKGRNPAKYQAHYVKVNSLFERALVLLNKMPRIWEMYLKFLMEQPLITTTRRTFDRALRALPITQHNRIWALYRPFANTASGETAVKIWKRYMQIHPEYAEDYIKLLVDMRQYTEAVKQYIKILNNPRFKSREVKSPFELLLEMLEVIVDHPADVETGPDTGIDVEDIVRSGISKFSDQSGLLWATLASYWLKKGDYEKAQDVYEEGMTTALTVRDFSIVFDACVEAEEAILDMKMNKAAARADKGIVDKAADSDLDIRVERFERLMNRRPFLVNDVLLRRDPNNVIEWMKRVALYGENFDEVVQTYTNAIAAINPKKAVGQFHELWVNYAKLYENAGDLQTARAIMDKAVKVPYKSVAELAETWIAWADLELHNGNLDRAVEIMAKATQAPKRSTVDYFDDNLSPQQRLHKSWKVWSYYVDLVEGVKSLDETRKVYERIFELRIATPQTVVNYANLLEENKYFEDSFKIYERGLDLFSYPVAFELWNLYLTKAVDRQISMERLRDLFEQAIEGCPPKFAKILYIKYGELEEERGLARHAMRIYQRATRAVAEEDRYEMFEYYITKSASNFGLTSTRPIYQEAIEELPKRSPDGVEAGRQETKEISLKFAELETRLGEIDRARAIYGHASSLCDPRRSPAFWKKWEAFEIRHGNEETYKEMLRVKRSVQAKHKYEDPTRCLLLKIVCVLLTRFAAPRLGLLLRRRLREEGSCGLMARRKAKRWVIRWPLLSER